MPASGSSWTRAAYDQGTLADDDECFFVDDAGRIFHQIEKKVRSWLRTRGRNCSPSRAHPRGLLSWRSRPCRIPSSGCSSGNAKLARPSTGTDALGRLSGRHHLVSRSCGSARGLRRESTTGTGIRASLRLTSLLFLLGKELYRQPRAVHKYWAGGLRSCVHAATSSSISSCSTLFPFIDKVLDIPVMLQ